MVALPKGMLNIFLMRIFMVQIFVSYCFRTLGSQMKAEINKDLKSNPFLTFFFFIETRIHPVKQIGHACMHASHTHNHHTILNNIRTRTPSIRLNRAHSITLWINLWRMWNGCRARWGCVRCEPLQWSLRDNCAITFLEKPSERTV